MPSISRESESRSHGLQLIILLSWLLLIHIQFLYPSLLLRFRFTHRFSLFPSLETKIQLQFLILVPPMFPFQLQLIPQLTSQLVSTPPLPTVQAYRIPEASHRIMKGQAMLKNAASLMMWLQSLNLRCLDRQHYRYVNIL